MKKVKELKVLCKGDELGRKGRKRKFVHGGFKALEAKLLVNKCSEEYYMGNRGLNLQAGRLGS